MTPPVQADNRQSNFSLVDGLIHVASDSDRTAGVTTHYGYLAPRLGVAYSPHGGKTALRAAFGVSYFADNFGAYGGTNERNYPFFQQIDLSTPTTFVPFRSISDGLPTFAAVPLSGTLTPPANFAVFYVAPEFHADTATMFNVGVQRELGWSTMGEVSYVGTRGTNLFRSYNINVPAPGPGVVQSRRPYFAIAPTITTINQRNGDGESWYDALQVKLDKRFSHGLQMLVAYTYSKTEDNVTPASVHPSLEDVRMPALSKTIDIPHIFSASWSYEIPAMGSGAARKFAEGWSISGITSYHSGDPLDIRVANSRLNTGSGNWPNVTCSGISMPRTIDKWFDTSCFADPAPYQFGNYRIGDVRGPSVFNTDVSAAKRATFGGKTAEIRIDIFNIFNRAHFDRPGVSNTGATFGTSSFGTISATRLTPREAQLGFRFLF